MALKRRQPKTHLTSKNKTMEAQELRIGNKVYYNEDHKEIGTVTSLMAHIDSHNTVGLNGRVNMTYDIGDLSGIPLSEQILLDCGFEYLQIDRYKFLKYKSDNLDFLFKDGKVKIGVQGVANVEWFMELEYLHNLQNFFALTNKELTINLTQK